MHDLICSAWRKYPGGFTHDAVTLENGCVVYTRLPGSSRPDSFTYTLRYTTGGITIRTVQLNVIAANAPVQKALSTGSLPDGSRQVLFPGVPGRIYRIGSGEMMDASAPRYRRKRTGHPS